MKPFLYYAALENGFTASTTFTSEETTFTFDNDKTYSPQNNNSTYGNNLFLWLPLLLIQKIFMQLKLICF